MASESESRIDKKSLIMAFEDEEEANAYYLDKDTGNVVLVRADLLDKDELTDEIEKNRERYLYIPKQEHKQLTEDLSDFISEIADQHTRSLLEVALESPNALFAVKKVLAGVPRELERWEKFRDGRISIRIRRWLEANFINLPDEPISNNS